MGVSMCSKEKFEAEQGLAFTGVVFLAYVLKKQCAFCSGFKEPRETAKPFLKLTEF